MELLPSGTVTLLFADMEGSTRLLEQLRERYQGALDTYRSILRQSFEAGGGREVDLQGDQIFVVFPRARDALMAAVAAQRAVAAHEWPDALPVRARIGLHTGEPVATPSGYIGMDVHTAARISAVAWGGQILVSQITRDLVGDDLPRDVALRDLGAHRLKDLTKPQGLFQVVALGLRAEFPALRSLDALPHNLPVQLTSFIGREREQEEVKELLRRTRLLTLSGPGGSGKTRLALQVAGDVLEDFPDGVWLADLTPVSDPALVPQTVAQAVRLREEGGQPVLEALTHHLVQRRILLVLDNCEHLVDAAAQVATTLLRGAAGVRILATSRERLGVAGEAAWPVPPLLVPDPEQPPPLDQLGTYEAVQLFFDRAVSAAPDFALTPQNAEAVASICRHLDGIPLALELAAARVAALSPQHIAERLGDRFRLLRGMGRGGPARHQTLWATVDWSYDLLSDAERALFRRLTVFGGSFSLEAAEAIAGNGEVDHAAVVDLIARLVDKSLITVKRDHGGDIRYRLLETLREYGRSRLTEQEEQAVRGRHLAFFQAFVTDMERTFEGPEEDRALDRLQREHDNLRLALDFGLDRDAEAALAMVASLSRFWHVRGHIFEGVRWVDQALARATGADPALRAKALALRGYLAGLQGEYGRAREFLDQSLSLYRALEDRGGIALALDGLGNLAAMAGDSTAARALSGESLEIFRKLGDLPRVHFKLSNLAHSIWHDGKLDEAQAMLDELIETAADLSGQGRLMALWTLGLIARDRGDYAVARRYCREALAIGRASNEMRYTSHLLETFAWLDAPEHPRRAALLLGAAETLRERINYPLPRSHRDDHDRPAERVISALGEEAFKAVKAEGRALRLEDAVQMAMDQEAPRRETLTRDDITGGR